jgi:hypothetical protein
MKNFNDLIVQNQSRNPTSQKRISSHIGFDTETLNGKLKLICYNNPDGTLKNHLFIDDNTNDTDVINQILKFLTKTEIRKSQKWFYNIDYDFRALLRWLPEKNIRELYDDGKTKYNVYTITHLPKKFFRISYNKNAVTFYDIMQFYPGGLDTNGLKYLKEQKDDKINSQILGISQKYWNENHNDIIKYCFQDCKITAGLGNLLYTDLWNEIQFNPKKPYSSGSIAQEFFINNSYIPIIKNIPESVLRFHQNNFRGGRVEILKRGHFTNLKSYDLKSAYPAQMINLLNYSEGNWYKTTEYDENITGIYEITYNCYHNKIGFFAQTYDGKTIYPIGENLKTSVNEKELLLLDEYPNEVEYTINAGYQFIPFNEIYPYRDLVMQLFNEKETTDDANKRMIYKLFINSIYGKTAQAIYDKKEHKFKTGKLYNPIYSNRITSLTRLEVLKESLKNPNDVVGFSTDAILTTTDNFKNIGNYIGNFTHEYTANDSCVLMSGVRYTDDKQKIRGFGKKLQIEKKDSAKKYNLKDVLIQNPKKSKIPVYVNKPVTIFQGLNYHNYTKDDINVFMLSEKILDINGDNRRIWKNDFSNCADALNRNIESAPIYI